MSNKRDDELIAISNEEAEAVSGGMMSLPSNPGGAPPMAYGSTIWVYGWSTPLPASQGEGVVIHFG